MSASEWIAAGSLIVAVVSFVLAYRSARLQTETFLMTLLAGKAAEANVFGDLGEKHPDPIHYQNAIATLVQATQIYDLIYKKHSFLLWRAQRQKFMSVFFLQWRTDLQNKIFDSGAFEAFLIANKTGTPRTDIQGHLRRIKEYFQASRDEFPPTK